MLHQEHMLRGFVHQWQPAYQDRPLLPLPRSKFSLAKRGLVTPSILNLSISVLLLEQIFLTVVFVQIAM